MLDLDVIFLRLGAAVVIGGLVGLNRDLHHKPSGLRTLSLVSLGAAVIVLAGAAAGDAAAASRIMQGIVAGVGFIGAGVIVRHLGDAKVHGLTTAATIWVSACIGAACGIGEWNVIAVAAGLMGLILLLGGRIEKAVHRWFDARPKPRETMHDEAG